MLSPLKDGGSSQGPGFRGLEGMIHTREGVKTLFMKTIDVGMVVAVHVEERNAQNHVLCLALHLVSMGPG